MLTASLERVHRPSIEPHRFTDNAEAKAITAETLEALGFEVETDPAKLDAVRFRTYSETDYVAIMRGMRPPLNRQPAQHTAIGATLSGPGNGFRLELGIGFTNPDIARDTYDWRAVVTRGEGETEETLFDNGNHDSDQSEFAQNLAQLMGKVLFGVEQGFQPAERETYDAWKEDLKVQIAPIAGHDNPYLL